MSEWYYHERIEEIDAFVEVHLMNDEVEDYMNSFTDEYEDWASYIGMWLEDKIGVLESIQKLVDALPDKLVEEDEE